MDEVDLFGFNWSISGDGRLNGTNEYKIQILF